MKDKKNLIYKWFCKGNVKNKAFNQSTKPNTIQIMRIQCRRPFRAASRRRRRQNRRLIEQLTKGKPNVVFKAPSTKYARVKYGYI